MKLVKVETNNGETVYIDQHEYQRKIGKHKLLKVFFSDGRLRTIWQFDKNTDECLFLHIDNIQPTYRKILEEE